MLVLTFEDIIELFFRVERLKALQRTGWCLAGINTAPESIADHSFGTTLITLILAHLAREFGEEINIEKSLTMAIIHDLPEALISDIPKRAIELGGDALAEGKKMGETNAIQVLFKEAPSGKQLMAIWQEYQQNESIEARVVHDADHLDMLIHALSLEASGVSSQLLDDFFIGGGKKYFSNLFELLHQMHSKNSKQ